jgi:16S rRNA (cytosine967-C5)-methyltransferase
MIYHNQPHDFAVVNEAVNQAKQYQQRSGAFVNAILRSAQRDIAGLVTTGDENLNHRAILWLDAAQGRLFKTSLLPDRGKNPAKYYSVAFSYPLWLTQRWLKTFDKDTVLQICIAGNARPLPTLRVNSLWGNVEKLKGLLDGVGVKTICKEPALLPQQPITPNKLPGYDEGAFYVQDITAMSAAPLLNPQPGQKILDLCAAPGGKTTHLGQLMNNQGTIIACDLDQQKLDVIRENCQRLGVNIVETCTPERLEDLSRQYGPFDSVLVDVPCSNTAVLARRVEARHLLKPIHIQRNSTTQYHLLEKASRFVKNGGHILYSTCSIEPAENDLLIKKFLQNNPKATVLQENLTLPEATVSAEANTTTTESAHASSYHDGGYTALIEMRTAQG